MADPAISRAKAEGELAAELVLETIMNPPSEWPPFLNLAAGQAGNALWDLVASAVLGDDLSTLPPLELLVGRSPENDQKQPVSVPVSVVNTSISSQSSSLGDDGSADARIEFLTNELKQIKSQLEDKKQSGAAIGSHVEIDAGNGLAQMKVWRTPEKVYEYRLEGLEGAMREVMEQLKLLSISGEGDREEVEGRFADVQGQLDNLCKQKRSGLFSRRKGRDPYIHFYGPL